MKDYNYVKLADFAGALGNIKPTTIVSTLFLCMLCPYLLTSCLLQGYLVEALKDKMKYLRNSKPRIKSENSNEMSEPPAKKIKKEFTQIPHIPAAPHIPKGEDEASYLRHLKVLQQEEKKMSPNKQVIADLMTRTFPFRRKEILEEPSSMDQLLKKFPSLKRTEQVTNDLKSIINPWPIYTFVLFQILDELNRILEKDAKTELHDIWLNTIPKIFEVARDETNSHVQSLLEDCKKDLSEGM